MAEAKTDYAALAQQEVEQGQVPTVPGTLYFSYKRVDGDDFVAPAANAATYLRRGYTIAGEQTIEDLAAWNAEQSAKEPAKATAAHHRGEHAEAKAEP